MTVLDPALPTTEGEVAPTDASYDVGTLRPAALVMLGATVIAGWFAAIGVAVSVQTSDGLHATALFLHLACLIAGFGAVLTLDWFGLLWLAKRKTLADVVDIADSAHLLIWLGLVGLTATGMMLEPRLGFWTCVKLVAVLLVALNGINAMRLNATLSRVSGAPGIAVMVWSGATAMVSQAGWWTACVIGFVNAH